jgi:hypothetical protein
MIYLMTPSSLTKVAHRAGHFGTKLLLLLLLLNLLLGCWLLNGGRMGAGGGVGA